MYDPSCVSCYGSRTSGKTSEDLIKEKENIVFVKRKLLENISFFSKSKLDVNSDLNLFRKTLVSKLQEDLSNISEENCELKDTAKFILEYNKILGKFMLPINNLGYSILPFYSKDER